MVGFSGGNKYFFPGISGAEVINFTHWLGAVMTNYVIIGTKHTPVRAVINRAAAMIERPKLCFSMVVAPAKGEVAKMAVPPLKGSTSARRRRPGRARPTSRARCTSFGWRSHTSACSR